MATFSVSHREKLNGSRRRRRDRLALAGEQRQLAVGISRGISVRPLWLADAIGRHDGVGHRLRTGRAAHQAAALALLRLGFGRRQSQQRPPRHLQPVVSLGTTAISVSWRPEFASRRLAHAKDESAFVVSHLSPRRDALQRLWHRPSAVRPQAPRAPTSARNSTCCFRSSSIRGPRCCLATRTFLPAAS